MEPATNDLEPAARPVRRPGRTDSAVADLVTVYLRDVARHPRLDAAEELALASRIAAGTAARRALASVSDGPGDAEERDRLEAIVGDGAEAKRRFVEGNLRLVPWTARRYYPTYVRSEPLDVYQDGNLGLMRAVDHFDPDRGKFSSMAVGWIRSGIQIGLQKRISAIRLPAYIHDAMRARRRAEEDAIQRLGRLPGDRDQDDVTPRLPATTRATFLHIDTALASGDAFEIADDDAIDPGEEAAAQSERDEARESAAVLTRFLDPIPRDVLARRFADPPETLEEIGTDLGITRERVRQIEQRALAMLQHPAFS